MSERNDFRAVQRFTNFEKQPSQLIYWQSKTMAERITAALEIIAEWHNWSEENEPRLERVHRIIEFPSAPALLAKSAKKATNKEKT